MMLEILKGVLNTEQLAYINDQFDAIGFASGIESAGQRAARVKNNQEAKGESGQLSALNNLVMGALIRHPVYLNAALPARVAAPIYARYTSGMGYGPHIDDPVMGQGQRYRTDMAITIFLNKPEEYEGGELEIGDDGRLIKLAAGDGVLYDADTIHQVREVRQGERRVAVTWVQSMIRDSARRQILYTLYQARDRMMNTMPDDLATTQIDQSYVNMVRMWADP